MQTKQKRLLIFGLVVFVLLLGIYVAFVTMRFRVVSIVPRSKGTVSTVTNGFKIEFNRELEPGVDYLASKNDPAGHVTNIDIGDDWIIVRVKPHTESQRYRFAIHNVRAKDGSAIGRVNFDYTARYTPIENLSVAEKELISEVASFYKKDYPIVEHLPYSTLDFKLSAEFDHVEESAQIGDLILRAQIFLSAADVKIDKEAATKAYKKAVRDYIVSIGFNPEDYHIEYEVIEPSLR